MSDFGKLLEQAPFLTLFAIIALGALLGTVRLRGVSLGPAGVFFAALLAGHFLTPYGWRIPHELTELGLVLFVYAVGLSAGARFFASLRRSGLHYLVVGLASTLCGAIVAIVLARAVGLTAELAAGMYCGATTCTPALAATLDAIQRAAGVGETATSGQSAAIVAYGATYPFSVVAVVLFIQWLPAILRTPAKDAAERFRKDQSAASPPIEIVTPAGSRSRMKRVRVAQSSKFFFCWSWSFGRERSTRVDVSMSML